MKYITGLLNEILMATEIWRVITDYGSLNGLLRQSCLVFTSVTSALEVSFNGMCYTDPRFSTYLLTYLLKAKTISLQVSSVDSP